MLGNARETAFSRWSSGERRVSSRRGILSVAATVADSRAAAIRGCVRNPRWRQRRVTARACNCRYLILSHRRRRRSGAGDRRAGRRRRPGSRRTSSVARFTQNTRTHTRSHTRTLLSFFPPTHAPALAARARSRMHTRTARSFSSSSSPLSLSSSGLVRRAHVHNITSRSVRSSFVRSLISRSEPRSFINTTHSRVRALTRPSLLVQCALRAERSDWNSACRRRTKDGGRRSVPIKGSCVDCCRLRRYPSVRRHCRRLLRSITGVHGPPGIGSVDISVFPRRYELCI